MNREIIIDGTNASLGRLASYAAKQSLLGKKIIIINCNKVVISGNRSTILEKYKKIRSRGGSFLKGPHFPRNPERIVKRTIRGMLSYKKLRGLTALKNIMCYNEVPKDYEESKKEEMKKNFNTRTLELKELSRLI